MAYYTSMFEDARGNYDPIRASRRRAHNLTRYYNATQYALTPLDPSSPSHPFEAELLPLPLPLPPLEWPPMDDERRAYEAAARAWTERQWELYDMPGAEMRPEFRDWNGRRAAAARPPRAGPNRLAVMADAAIRNITRAAATVAITAATFEARNRLEARLRLWVSRGHYRATQRWRALAVDLRNRFTYTKFVLLTLFGIWALAFAMLKVGSLMSEDPYPAEYVFIVDPMRWSVGGLECSCLRE